MKLYNPFKPHIVKLGEYYLVRKLTLAGWAFRDKDYLFDFWWTTEKYVRRYCVHQTLEEAKKAMSYARPERITNEVI